MKKIAQFCLILLISIPLFSLSAQPSLSIDKIMEGADFVGHLPSRPFWSDDSQSIYFRWDRDSFPDQELYSFKIGDTNAERLSLESQKQLPSTNKKYNRDYTRYAYTKNGDLFLRQLSTEEEWKITNTIENENLVSISSSGDQLIFRKGINLFCWSEINNSVEQLTNFRSGKENESAKDDAHKAWLRRDQLEYFEILNERDEDLQFDEQQDEILGPKRPLEIYLGGDQLRALCISPDLNFVFYSLVDDAKPESTTVPSYVTESGYTKELPARPKVGDQLDSYKYYVYNRRRDTVVSISTKEIPGIYDKPAFLKDYHVGPEEFVDTFETAREVYMTDPIFNETGSHSVVVLRSFDNKDRWIMELDLESGGLILIDHQHDDAWIGGPGISSWNFSAGNAGVVDENTFWYQSEETGYSHIYLYDFTAEKSRALTKGKFEILSARLSRDRTKFFVTANKENPFENHFYHLSLDGIWTKITPEVGNNQVVVSPDENNLALLYSYSNQPTELFWMENSAGAETNKVTESTTKEFLEYPWRDPDIIFFEAKDGVQIPARIYRPKLTDKNGAAVIFVHGAGYLHNVHRWWSSYYREYMFHNFLADRGYTVLDIDYRGSAGYGSDWRTAIYRHMGGKDLSDQVDGAKYLVGKEGIDADRIGIYGGSYGGFITLMALCTSPGTFKCGAALRSVTDWAHYNHGYTSNILNTPVLDSIAYYRSSPIYHAEGLAGELLMLHGMVDRNVHFQDVVRLSQRFIELGKEGWELAVFPMEGHGFVESSSWKDEYKRIFKLFKENLLE